MNFTEKSELLATEFFFGSFFLELITNGRKWGFFALELVKKQIRFYNRDINFFFLIILIKNRINKPAITAKKKKKKRYPVFF